MLHFTRRSGIATFACATVAIGVYVYFIAATWEEPPGWPNYSMIEEGLYLGGAVHQPPKGTVAVLNLCEGEDPYRCPIHSWEPIPDAEPAPSLDWLRKRVEFVDAQRSAGIPTYVHCAGGVSRGGMVAVAYYMLKNKWSRDEALTYVRSKRDVVNPNPAFMKLLLEWETEIKK